MRVVGVCVSIAAVGVTFLAQAHHSPAAFDLTKETVVAGTIREVSWTNPHTYLTLASRGADGAEVLQKIEVEGPHTLQTSGVTRDTLALGANVTVRAMPNRRGAGHIVLGLDLTTSDGAVYPLHPRGRTPGQPAAKVPAESLAGKWVTTAAVFGAFNRAAQSWPVTPAGAAARNDVESILAAATGCAPAYSQPVLMALHVLREIKVTDTAVVIRLDGVGVERTIHLDMREHPADLEPTFLGHSIGHWEGETLVIDTVGFSPHRQGTALGVPSSPAKHFVERLALAADRLHLRYEFTIEDPAYLTAPVTYEMQWDHRPDLERSDVACDADDAKRFLEE